MKIKLDIIILRKFLQLLGIGLLVIFGSYLGMFLNYFIGNYELLIMNLIGIFLGYLVIRIIIA